MLDTGLQVWFVDCLVTLVLFNIKIQNIVLISTLSKSHESEDSNSSVISRNAGIRIH